MFNSDYIHNHVLLGTFSNTDSSLNDTKEKLVSLKSKMNILLEFKSHSNLLTDKYIQTPLYTVGEQIQNFRVTGIFDGMGAYLKDNNTVNLLLNS